MAALEGATEDSSVGMAFSHNPTAFASIASSCTCVIDAGATDHVIGIRSVFQSYTSATDGRVRIADGSSTQVARKGTVCILPNLSLSLVLHVPSFSFSLFFC